MGFPIFLTGFAMIVTVAAVAIIGRMPFPPLLLWAARMIVLLIAGITIYAGLQVP